MSTPRLLAAVLLATMVAPPVAAQEDASTSSSSDHLVVVGTGGAGLELRAGPGFDQPPLGALPEGTIVQVLDGPTSDGLTDWFAVQPPRSSGLPNGYCSAMYLAQAPAADAGLSSQPPARTITLRVTGYASGADGGAVGSTTASGVRTHWGTVAADTRLFPFGTRLQIDGFAGVTFTVEDTGSAVSGNVIDVWFPDVPTAVAFGTKVLKVTILPNDSGSSR